MKIISVDQKNKITLTEAVKALRQGRAVVYPTDTSYGLAVDAKNSQAAARLYKVKGRSFKKPVHIVVPSVAYAKRMVVWGKQADMLAKAFWPGALTIVSKLKVQSAKSSVLTAGTGFLGVRMPANDIALSLSKKLNSPITATSANVSGMPDCYSIDEVVKQFANKNHKPDIIINSGRLPRRKPSTVLRIDGDRLEILRPGPISKKQIERVIKTNVI